MEQIFNVTEILLDRHNSQIVESKEKFVRGFNEAFKILIENGFEAYEFEKNLYDYFKALKEEYFKAGFELNLEN